MNLDRDRFFIVSGFISLSFFALIVAIIGWQTLIVSKPEIFAMTQSETISVSLVSSLEKSKEPIPEPLVSPPVVKPAVEEVTEKIPEVTPPEKVIPKTADKSIEKPIEKSEEKSEEVAISDLFSTVKPNKPVSKPKEDGKRLAQLNALEEKVLSTKRDSKLFEKAKTLELAKTGVKLSSVSGSSGPLVNEYKGKIQGIIYANFHPPGGTEGFSARVRITLSADGKLLSYRVISYSRSALFNAEVDWLKERLGHVALPVNPNGDEAVFEIILTAKG